MRGIHRRTAILATAMGVGDWARAQDDTKLDVGGSSISVRFAPGDFDLGTPRILDWVKQSARAVATYYGKFPVAQVGVRIRPKTGTGISNATTWGGPPPFTRISVGQQISQAELEDDWVMTHEFVHTGFPSVPRRHHWIEEGIATYVEPVARVQAGHVKVDRIWAEMFRDMPKGQPQAADEGLDHTHTWGRTYWGGGLFCLVADVTIRERTNNRKGLQHALRGILNKGGTIDQEWTMDRALEVGDQAVGVPVLTELYTTMKDAPVEVDLPGMWRRLGVVGAGDKVALSDQAPLAHVRRAITATFA